MSIKFSKQAAAYSFPEQRREGPASEAMQR